MQKTKLLSHLGCGEEDAKWTREDEGHEEQANDFHSKFFVRVLPVNEVKVFLKVSWVNVGFAQLKMSPRVVLNVVDTHFLHDAKTSLRRQRDLKGDKKENKDAT